MDKYIQQAIELASSVEVQRRKQRLGAICLDSKGRVLSKAVNSYKRTHPLFKHFAESVGEDGCKAYGHAEFYALLKCKTRAPVTVCVARVMKDGSVGMAKPCNICVAALRAFGVKYVCYTNNSVNSIESLQGMVIGRPKWEMVSVEDL